MKCFPTLVSVSCFTGVYKITNICIKIFFLIFKSLSAFNSVNAREFIFRGMDTSIFIFTSANKQFIFTLVNTDANVYIHRELYLLINFLFIFTNTNMLNSKVDLEISKQNLGV